MGGPDGLAGVHRPGDPARPPPERRGDRGRHLLAALRRRPGRHGRGVERQRRTDNGVAMPILDARHDLAHPVEGDTAWSESYYFNAYDPGSDSGLFTRIGIRPNEGTMDVGMSLWLPGRRAGRVPLRQGAARDGRHRARGRRRPLRDARGAAVVAHRPWTATCRPARACAGRGDDAPGPRRARRALRRHDAGHRHRRPAERRAASRPRRRPRPARWARGTSSRRAAGRARSPSTACATSGTAPTATATAPGARAAGAARRCGAGSPSTSARTCTSAASASAPTPATCTGAGCGTAGGPTSVAEWRVRTELADDGVTHRVVHLEVVDKAGRTYPLRGDVLRVADIGRAGGTHGQRGPGPLDLRGRTARTAAHRLRHLPSTCTSSTTPGGRSSLSSSRPGRRPTRVSPRLSSDELAAALGRVPGWHRARPAAALGRRFPGHQRVRPGDVGPAPRPLILQMDRERRRRRGGPRLASSAPCSSGAAGRRPRARRRRGPASRRRRADGPAGRRLAGGRAARGRDDPAQDPP